MKHLKMWAIALALTSMTLTSCLSGNSGETEQDPVYPGYVIYQGTTLQNNLSMLYSEVGVRMAMLIAEAQKQGLEEKWLDVKSADGKTLVRTQLFSGTSTLEAEEEGYTVTFQMISSSGYNGTVIINTNGINNPANTDNSHYWEISSKDFSASISNGYSITKYLYEGGKTRFYHSHDNTYILDVLGIAIKPQNSQLVSDWTGSFELTVPDAALAYSDCSSKEFPLDGTAFGRSFLSYDASGIAATLQYQANITCGAKSGRMKILKGTEKCSFIGMDYNMSYYPSPDVTVTWSEEGEKSTITYNGVTK